MLYFIFVEECYSEDYEKGKQITSIATSYH